MLETGGEHKEVGTRQDTAPDLSATAPSGAATTLEEGQGILETASDQQPNGPFLDDGVPFAAQSAIASRPVLQPSMFDTVTDLTHRWRVPLSLLLGVVLSGTIYVAYRTSFDDAASSDALTLVPPTTAVGFVAENETDVESEPEAANGPATAAATESDADSSSVSDSTTATTSIGNASTTAVTTQPTEPPTTPTTAPTTTTTEPTTTTTSTTIAPQPATVSGTVSFDSGVDQKVKSLEVRLIPDSDEGRLEAFTGNNGIYLFEAVAACYRVRFVVPDGQQIVDGNQNTSVCLDAGQAITIDLTITLPAVRAPRSCEIQIGDDPGAGVELYDPQERWAGSYVFYGESGQFLLSTYGLGPPDDLDAGEPSIEWTSDGNGFEESDVYAVAAEHPQGVTSQVVQCSRRVR